MRLFTVVPPSADSEAAQGVHATDLGTLIPPVRGVPARLPSSLSLTPAAGPLAL